MKLFAFLDLLTSEKFPFKMEYISWNGNVRVTVDTFSKLEIYEFNETGIVEFSEWIETITTEENGLIDAKVKELINRPLRTWIRASEDLGIEFIYPYRFVGIDHVEYEATGLLPEFGHGKGVLITSRKDEYEISLMADLTHDYLMTGLSPSYYDHYDRVNIIATLSAWGWNGSRAKPDWIKTE